MALDGILIHNLITEFKHLEGGRIQKISQVGNNDFLFVVRSNNKNKKLFTSIERNSYRICLTDKEYVAPKTATMFTMLLRKQLEGGIINSIYQYDLDRIVIFDIEKINEFGDNKHKKLIFELMGKNSNLIITDTENIIIDAFKHNGITEEGRTILPKIEYLYPEISKINIFEEDNDVIKASYEEHVNDFKDIINTFNGFSPLLAHYIFDSIAPVKTLLDIKTKEISPSIIVNNNKKDFYFFDIAETVKTYSTISEMLEDYYYLKTIENEVNEKSNNLKTHIEHTITKLKNKIVKLDQELEEAKAAEKYKVYGELIMNNLYQIPSGNFDKITLFNYYTSSDITIPLDKKISVKQNGEKFFIKYQKGKKAVSYIEQQQQIARDEIEYLELILLQIKKASVKDIEQIQSELLENHYLKQSKGKDIKKRKEKIEILTYLTSDGTEIFVGKNNIQNEFITHTLAKPNELWFHVKDAPGSHVLLRKSDDYTEEDIRTSAILAAYYSTYSDSTSVAVQYTKARFIKKIPGKRNCFVTMTNEKTIYIDPDIEIIDKLKKK